METNKIITLFNAYVDQERRIEVFHGTVLDVHYHEGKSSSLGSGGTVDASLTFQIRIPYPQKEPYVRSGYSGEGWTLRKGDYIIPASVESGDGFSKADITEMAKEAGEDVITIVEYADNTIHGSDRVKHWRIGGK